MKKDKGSLAFWLTVCVLIACVAMAKDSNNTSQAKNSTDVVYPDYYYAKTSDDSDTTGDENTHHTDQVQPDDKQEDTVHIDETIVPLADTMDEDTSASRPQASTKNAVQNTAASLSSAVSPASTSILERKSQILSDMAQSSVLANSTQALANAVITAKTVKYQTLATSAAVGAATLHNQRREAVLDLIETKQKSHTETANRVITQTGETTKKAFDTALTIHNDINQNVGQIHDDIKQNADKIESDVKDTIDKIHQKHDEIKDILDKLGSLPDFPRIS